MGLQFLMEILEFVYVIFFLIPIILEQVVLVGEGEYNLNALKVIEVTESYIGMDNGCQNGESLQDCATNHFVGKVLEQCGCLPFNIRLSEKVSY